MAWLTGYVRRIPITIDNTNIDSDLTDFPILIKFTDNTTIGANIDSNGYNIRFTTSDGETLLKYERQSFSLSAGQATAIFWVKIPTLSGSVDTTIYIYFKGGSATDGEDPTNVWDANFVGVYHMQETPAGADSILDSTANANHLTSVNMDVTNVAAGKLGNSIDFDGSTEYLNRAAAIVGTVPFTISCLVNPDSLGQACGILSVSKSGDAGNHQHALLICDSTATGGTSGSSASAMTRNVINTAFNKAVATGSLSATTWNYVIGKWNTIASRACYRDSGNSGTNTTSCNVSGLDLFDIGRLGDSTPNFYFNGKLQEVRLSDSTRSVEWGKFEYYNIFESDNELSFGAEEVLSIRGLIIKKTKRCSRQYSAVNYHIPGHSYVRTELLKPYPRPKYKYVVSPLTIVPNVSVGGGGAISVSLNCLIEHLTTLSILKNIPLDYTLYVSTDTNNIIEQLLSVDNILIAYNEQLATTSKQNQVLLEQLLNLSLLKTTDIEHLLYLANTFTELTEHNQGLSDENISLIEHALNLSLLKPINIEQLLSLLSNLTELIEHNQELSDTNVVLTEHTLNLSPLKQINIEQILNLSSLKPINIEHLLYLLNNSTEPIEYNQGLSAERILLVEHILNLVNEKINILEHLVSVTDTGTALIEQLVNMTAAQKANLLEHLLTVGVNNNVPIEQQLAGVGLVTASKILLIEHLATLSNNYNLLTEWKLQFSALAQQNIEQLLNLSSGEKAIILSNLLKLSSLEDGIVEYNSNFSTEKGILIDNLLITSNTLGVPLESLSKIISTGVLYTEWLANISIDKNLLIEWLLTGDAVSFSTSKLIVIEHLASVSDTQNIPIDWLAGATAGEILKWILCSRSIEWVLDERTKTWTLQSRPTSLATEERLKTWILSERNVSWILQGRQPNIDAC